MTRRQRRCNIIGVLLGLCVVAPPVTMLLDRRAVVDLDAANSFIVPNPARSGQDVSIIWRATSLRNCEGVVIPRIVDSSGRIFEYSRLPTVYRDIMRPGERSFTKIITLPTSMAPGPARYEAIVIRWCNPIQRAIWSMVDRPFPIRFNVVP